MTTHWTDRSTSEQEPRQLALSDVPFLGYETLAPAPFGLRQPRAVDGGGESRLQFHEGGSHLLSVGATGSGKTNLLIANLLLYRGPAIVIDVRGDAMRATARFRRDVLGQTVHILAPFDRDIESARLDPLDIISLPDTEIESEAQSVGSLLGSDVRSERDPYWSIQGGALIASICAHLMGLPDRAQRSMNRLTEILFEDDTAYYLAKMLDDKVVTSKFAYQGIAAFLQLPDASANTRFCVLSTAQSMVQPYRSAAIRAAMGPSTIDLRDLLEGKPSTIYICIPVERIASHAPVLRLWIDVMLQALLRRTRPASPPTLVMVDECAQIGPTPSLKSCATYLRANGVRLWTFWQDLNQIKSLFPLDWTTLVTNTSALTFLPGNGLAATELGAMAGVPPTMISGLACNEQLVCETGLPARVVRMAQYWRDRDFEGRFDPLARFTDTGTEPGR
jgi:type IV secretion system protein VirD4